MSEVRVVDYDPDWPRVFEALREPIWRAVSDFAISIEHVGSTAVPGLAAKPVIDIDVVVPDDAVAAGVAALEAIGYVHRGDCGVPSREAFKAPPDAPRHHLYLCPASSPALANHLAIRDHLRATPAKAFAYGQLKRRLALELTHDIDGYVEGKTSFLVGILEERGFPASALAEIRRVNSRPGQRLPLRLIPATSENLWTTDDLARLATPSDYRDAAHERDGVGRSLLHIAAGQGDLAAMRGLLAEGADVNAATLVGEPPLISAVRGESVEAVALLLAAGANVDVSHLNGGTALTTAVGRGHEHIVELLLAKKPFLDPALIMPGVTPVRIAVQTDRPAILRRLLKAGARHDLRAFDGLTPLELARSLGRAECERVLLNQ